jgi:uncharacterized protein YmfQ (DUF2313 family)
MGIIWNATIEDFLRILQGLLPRGLIWTRDPARRLTRLLKGLADEFVRVQNRAGSIMEEADPQTTTAAGLLPEWERVTGLPEFGYYPTTEDDRRATLVGKLAAQGGQSAEYFESIAAAMGAIDCTVENTGWTYVWSASSPSHITRARCNSPCNAPLVGFDETGKRVWAAFNKYKPAHTAIWWTGA